MLGEDTETLISPHFPVGKGLVPSRVSENQIGVITPGRHKTGPYDVVVIRAGGEGRQLAPPGISAKSASVGSAPSSFSHHMFVISALYLSGTKLR